MNEIKLFNEHLAPLTEAQRVELRRETQILPAMCGLPRVIRAFITVTTGA